MAHETERMSKRIADLETENAKLRAALDALLDHDLANRDTEDEFFICHTYGKKMPAVIVQAKAALAEAVR